jgi:hypothetical protein
MNLKDMTDEELKAELKRRKQEREAAETPKPVDNPDFSGLIEMFQGEIRDICKGNYHDDTHSDFIHYVYETAAEAIYGKDFFKWYNKKVQ